LYHNRKEQQEKDGLFLRKPLDLQGKPWYIYINNKKTQL